MPHTLAGLTHASTLVDTLQEIHTAAAANQAAAPHCVCSADWLGVSIDSVSAISLLCIHLQVIFRRLPNTVLKCYKDIAIMFISKDRRMHLKLRSVTTVTWHTHAVPTGNFRKFHRGTIHRSNHSHTTSTHGRERTTRPSTLQLMTL